MPAKDEGRKKGGRWTGDEGVTFSGGNRVVTSLASARGMRLYYPDRKCIREEITGPAAFFCDVQPLHSYLRTLFTLPFTFGYVRSIRSSAGCVPTEPSITVYFFFFALKFLARKFKSKNMCNKSRNAAVKKLLSHDRRASWIHLEYINRASIVPDKNYSN